MGVTNHIEGREATLLMAPSGYRRYTARQRNPDLQCARAKQDALLTPEIHRVWQTNMRVYGADKVWRQLHREKQAVARCTAERLMRRLDVQGARRDKMVYHHA